MERLRQTLRRIDGRGYRAYQDLRGDYRFDDFELFVDHVQGDPYAAPSRMAVVVSADAAGLPDDLWRDRARRVATEDWLTRRVAARIPSVFRSREGSGSSGKVRVDAPGTEVLERTSCLVDDGGIELRLSVGLPAAGRRVLGRAAESLLVHDLAKLVSSCLLADAHDAPAMRRHADCVQDQSVLRGRLAELGLAAFVAEGAALARASGVDDTPLQSGAVPFAPVPESLAIEVELPHAGRVRGLGIPRGITVIVGGGYHGKSTLLEALARGVYDHVPGDGRHQVVTSAGAVTIRAEDGRSVSGVGIDGFISDLPNGADTRAFGTARASGSTSQAAAVMEALEAGADTLLIDEDTSASNFLSRDYRMQLLVPPSGEPIQPFVDRVVELRDRFGVSTIMVMGGSSDYFEVADHVIRMDAYRPRDVSAEVRAIAEQNPTARAVDHSGAALVLRPRVPTGRGLEPTVHRRGGSRQRVKARDTRAIQLGEHELDVSLLSQLVDPSQTRALGDALVFLHSELVDGRLTIAQLADALRERIRERGLCGYAARRHGDRAAVRALDVIAAMNRLRELEVRCGADP